MSLKKLSGKVALSGVTLLVLVGMSAHGQYQAPAVYPQASAPVGYGAYPASRMSGPPPYSGGMYPSGAGMCPPNGYYYPRVPSISPQPYYVPPHLCVPGSIPPSQVQPAQPDKSTTPSETPPSSETPRPSDQSNQSAQSDTSNPFDTSANTGQDPSLSGLQGGAGGGSGTAMAAPGGYLDNPIPITTFRIRNDAAFNQNRPDRAEYFYGAWKELSFHPHGVQGGGVFYDPTAKGPNLLPANLNYQQPEAYFEMAFLNIFSGFIQVPYRIVQFNNLQEDFPESEMKRNPADQPNPGSKFFPEPGPENQNNPQTRFNGFSDLQFGFKLALLGSPTQFLTFQFRTYSPTANASQGLGTGHWSLEPSLLYYKRFDRLVLQGQLTEWSPLAGGEAGNIMEYGAGLGYAVYQRGNCVIMPITEFLGWTVLNGYEAVFAPISATAPAGLELPLTHGVEQAGGNTIVNGKFGVRVFWGNGQSLYAGYGRALTGTHWYTDDFRLEYRIFFGRNPFAARPL